MNTQPDLFSLLDDTSFKPYNPAVAPIPVTNYLPERKPVVVTGWLKSYCGPALPSGAVTTLPTLNKVTGDGMRYMPCAFELKPGVSAEEYPGPFGLRGLRLKGSKLLISLYDAVEKGLAAELAETEVAEMAAEAQGCGGGVAPHA